MNANAANHQIGKYSPDDINGFPFDDLYVNDDSSDPTYTSSLDGEVVRDLPMQFKHDLDQMISRARQRQDQDNSTEFELTFGNGPMKIIYRVTKMDTLAGTQWIFRKSLVRPLELMQMGFHPFHSKVLRLKGRETGIFIVAGAQKQGKTSTSSSMFVDWATTYGGINVTVEGPPELPLEGRYGNGRIFQTRVSGDDWKGAVKRSLRYGSRRLFMGELRERESVGEMIRMGLANSMVLSTVHASSVKSAISSINHYLEGDKTSVANFSQSFRGIIVQELRTKNHVKVPFVKECLYVHEGNQSDIAAAIVSGNVGRLEELAEQDYNLNIKPIIEAYKDNSGLPKPRPNET